MDSLTQVILGAAVGYAVAGKELGKKSILLGATAGIIPDLDVLPLYAVKNEFFFLKHHRGFSHSLIFTVLGAFGFTWLLERTLSLSKGKWAKHSTKQDLEHFDRLSVRKIFFFGFFTHILLDCFTTWGTQVFWPHPYRVAWNSIFIVDPFYSVPLLLGLLIAIISRSKPLQKKAINITLILSTSYLILGLGIKAYMHNQFLTLFEKNGIDVIRYTSRPSPFNLILWSANAETKDGYYYGMVSLCDTSYESNLYYTPKNHHLLDDSFVYTNVNELLAYTKGYYSIEKHKNGLLIHDLRYGFMGDPWQNNGNFVFSYFIQKGPHGNMQLSTHNPRPSNTSELLEQLWVRLKGI